MQLCHCGRPLHYNDDNLRQMVEAHIRARGEYISVTAGQRTWAVPRHYIALHGIRAIDLPTLGFDEVVVSNDV